MEFRNWFLLESKQSIVGLRYPEVIAELLHKKFGNNAFTIAKWFREYRFSENIPDNWWLQIAAGKNSFNSLSLYDLTVLYKAADNPEKYQKTLDELSLNYEKYGDIENQKKHIKKIIEYKFFDNSFFNYNLIKDISDNKLKNIAPYKRMKFWDAQHKYDQKNIFQDTIPIKTYKNGFKWINVGKRCNLVAHLMKNCGSAGLMSLDNDATMIVLFGPENTPHVVVTYSPNQKRISGDEGVGSTEVKTKYHNYILDLAEILGVEFDYDKSKSQLLKMKYLLKGKSSNIRLVNHDIYEPIFRFDMQGKVYYSNGYVIVSKEDIEKAQEKINQGEIVLVNNQKNIIKNVFNHRNQPMLADTGVKYIRLDYNI